MTLLELVARRYGVPVIHEVKEQSGKEVYNLVAINISESLIATYKHPKINEQFDVTIRGMS